MRKLKAWLYVTLDGVVEAPENWVLADDEMFAEQTAGYAASDALLLGRRTYEIFAAAWPQRGSLGAQATGRRDHHAQRKRRAAARAAQRRARR
jgi:dihydrofolate reductase